jgi:hypothetical protein
MEDAVTDLAGNELSLLRWAVHDVYRAANPDLGSTFAECGATAGALLAMNLVAPPLAIVAGVTLAAKGILEVVLAHIRDRDAYWCALNPADSFGMEPSLVRLALRCAGEVASAIPGSRIAIGFAIVAPLSAEIVP